MVDPGFAAGGMAMLAPSDVFVKACAPVTRKLAVHLRRAFTSSPMRFRLAKNASLRS